MSSIPSFKELWKSRNQIVYPFQDETLAKYQLFWNWLQTEVFKIQWNYEYIFSFERHSTARAFIRMHHYDLGKNGIFMNPDSCNRSDEEILSTIAHEFCHALEINRGYEQPYHRKTWINDMESIGLKPIKADTLRVTHNITDKFRDLIKSRPPECCNLQLNKPERKKDKGKNCYICSDPNCEYDVKVWGKKNLRLYCGFCSTDSNLVELINKG
jgi:predicted SprT family Zn-dependent metalloprotease